MDKNRWVELKPIGYVGMALGLIGIFGPELFANDNALIRLVGLVVFIFGIYLVLYKGRKEHGI